MECMSRISRTKLVVGSFAVVSVLIACSDSTGPSAAHLAQHFDSLYSAAAANESIGYSIRAQVITDLEIPIAFGAIPREVNVSTSTGVEHWKGFEFAINPDGSQFESNNILVLYRDANAHTVLVTSFAQNGSITSASLLVNDTLRVISSDFGGSSSLSSTDAGCPDPPQLVNPGLVPYVLSACEPAEFTSSATAEFAIGPNIDAALGHLEFGSAVFPGEVFTSGFGEMGSRILH
jgi:hypothetical protein